MLNLGETVNTFDVALLLKNQYGVFEITAPDGDIVLVSCTPNHAPEILEWKKNAREFPYQITKIAEPAGTARLSGYEDRHIKNKTVAWLHPTLPHGSNCEVLFSRMYTV